MLRKLRKKRNEFDALTPKSTNAAFPPRVQQVLTCLLEGLAEKQIAGTPLHEPAYSSHPCEEAISPIESEQQVSITCSVPEPRLVLRKNRAPQLQGAAATC